MFTFGRKHENLNYRVLDYVGFRFDGNHPSRVCLPVFKGMVPPYLINYSRAFYSS